MALKKKSKHYLLAEDIAKGINIQKKHLPIIVKGLSRQILKSMNKHKFILVKVK